MSFSGRPAGQRSVPALRGVYLNDNPRRDDRKGPGMTETTSPALRIALAYFQAWTSHDLDTAMGYIADDIVCHAPAGRLDGRDAYLAFMRPFVQILTGSELIAAMGDDTTAVIVYDTATVPVASAPAAECVTVTAGKITRNRFIFDRVPFDAARRAAG
jgi:ketosteroid isomerase-like protein